MLHDVENSLLKQAAHLHFDALSYRSFITLFGEDFLYQLYKGIIGNHFGFIICCLTETQLRGFILASFDNTKLLSVIFKQIHIFAAMILPKIIRKPSLIWKLYQMIKYNGKSDIGTKAELVVIAVDRDFRSKGIGSKLIDILDKEYQKHNISQYRTTVHRDMADSNKFYLRNGMNLVKTFVMFDVHWNVYIKNISSEEVPQNAI